MRKLLRRHEAEDRLDIEAHHTIRRRETGGQKIVAPIGQCGLQSAHRHDQALGIEHRHRLGARLNRAQENMVEIEVLQDIGLRLGKAHPAQIGRPLARADGRGQPPLALGEILHNRAALEHGERLLPRLHNLQRGDPARGAQRPKLGAAQIAIGDRPFADLAGQAQFLEQPEHPNRARARHMMQPDHAAPALASASSSIRTNAAPAST